MLLSDRVTGLFVAGLGALSAWGGSRLPAVPGQDVGPAAFPMLIGGGLVICGIMIAFGIGHSFEVEEEPAAGPGPWHLGGLRALIPPLLLLFYVLASDRLGFLLTAFVMVLVAATALGARPKLALPLGVVAPLGVHAVFAKLLRVPLPDGILPAFW